MVGLRASTVPESVAKMAFEPELVAFSVVLSSTLVDFSPTVSEMEFVP